MSTVDSNDPQKEALAPEELSLAKQKARAQKEQDKKNEANNNFFADICYHVFITKLNLHYHALQLIEQHKKLAAEMEKEKYRTTTEDDYARSIESYNKALKERVSTESTQMQSELGKRVSDLMERLVAAIAKLNEEIRFLDREIVRVKQDLTDIKKNLADEIKKIFLDENLAIGFTSRPSIVLALPDDYRHKPGAERFQGTINIDKILYQQFANLLAERVENDKMRFQDFQLESNEAARAAIKSEIRKLVAASPFIPEQDKEKVINKMMTQPKVIHEIDTLVNKLHMAVAKQPAAAALLDAGCQKERELQELDFRKDKALEKLKTLESLKQDSSFLESQQSNDKPISASAVAALEAAVHQATNVASVATPSPIEPALTAVSKCTERLDDIKGKAEVELKESAAPIPPERQTEIKKEICQTIDAGEAALQKGLDDLLKSYGVVADDNSDDFRPHQGPSLR